MHHALTRTFTKSAALIALALTCAAPLMTHAEAVAVAPEPIQAQVQPQGLIEDFHPGDRSCRGQFPGKRFARTELFFGLSRPGGVVTDQEFQIFVDQFVTPKFPDGLTLLAGTGQFRDASGAIISEGSKLLILLYPRRDRDASDKIEQIRTDYKDQFLQQSVLRSTISTAFRSEVRNEDDRNRKAGCVGDGRHGRHRPGSGIAARPRW